MPCARSVYVIYSATSQLSIVIRICYIAPIGTKPHAVGALLYALEEKTNCQIIYDHPTPRKVGTSGIGKTHLYRVN